jgi:hypothetical protein
MPKTAGSVASSSARGDRSKIVPTPLKGDSRRQAVPALRGYFYQIWWSLYSWVTLREGESLYLEGAEDFDVASKRLATATQVREVSQLSLGREEARFALDHFLLLKEKNPGRNIRYRYLTTARAVKEKGSPFGSVSGLEFWKKCQQTGRDTEALSQYFLKSEKISQRVRNFFERKSPTEILEELIRPVAWETTAPARAEVEDLILSRLVHRGDRYGVAPSESKKAVNRLLRETLEAATRSDRRELTAAYYYSVFEEETSVRVSRAEAQVMSLAQLPWAPHFIQRRPLDLFSWAQLSSPPSFEAVSNRKDVVRDLHSSLIQSGLVVITGTTGMGKTNLAKQVAANAERLLWLPLRTVPTETRVHFCHVLSLAAPSSIEAGTIVVFDDLNRDWFVPPVHDQLTNALMVLRKLDVLILATSTEPFPKRLSRQLGLTQACDRAAPVFSRKEIVDLAEILGCPTSVAQHWSGLVEMHSQGHPQLVHAYLISLRNRGWPTLPDVAEELLRTPNEVRHEQEEVRTQLLLRLSGKAVRLLHYLSLIGSTFRRDHAMAVGEKLAVLEAPGLVFDSLVGPWVQAVHSNYFLLSPLLSNAGEYAFTDASRRDARHVLAEIFARTGTATASEVSSALMCAISGQNAKVLAIMSLTLIQTWPKDIGASVASRLSWLAWVDLDGKSLESWCPPEASSTFRLLQFRVASLVNPECCDQIVARCAAEAQRIENADMREVQQLSLCMAVVYEFAGKASLECALSCVVRQEELWRQIDKNSKMSEFKRTVAVPPEFKVLWDVYPASLDFFIVTQRVETVGDIELILHSLERLGEAVRNKLLGLVVDGLMEPSFLHSAWIRESRLEKPKWEPVVGQLRSTMKRVQPWGIPSLYRAAAFAIIIIESEYLKNYATAHELLNSLERTYGTSLDLLEKRATVFFVEGRHEDALPLWREILGADGQKPHPLLPQAMHSAALVLSRRKAAISNAAMERWADAVALFLDACRWAYTMSDRSYRSALQADAAFCAFRGGDRELMVELLDLAVTEIVGLIEVQNDAEVRITLRLLSHLLLWLIPNSGRESGDFTFELAEPQVGFCSNLERPEMIDTLPLLPIDCVFLYLCKVEWDLTRQRLIFERERDRLVASRYAFVRSEAYNLDMRNDFKRHEFRYFAVKVARFLRASSVSQKRYIEMKNNGRFDLPLSADIADILGEVPEGDEPEVLSGLSGDILVAALLCIRTHTADEEHAVIQAWEKSGAECGASWPEFPSLIRLVQEARRWSLVEAKKVLYDYSHDRDRRMLSVLMVATNSSSGDADSLFYAHVLLFEALSQGVVKDEVAVCLATNIERQWRRLAGTPALLQNPRFSVEPILEACNSADQGYQKAARVLVVAEMAVKIKLPGGLRNRIREAAVQGL